MIHTQIISKRIRYIESLSSIDSFSVTFVSFGSTSRLRISGNLLIIFGESSSFDDDCFASNIGRLDKGLHKGFDNCLDNGFGNCFDNCLDGVTECLSLQKKMLLVILSSFFKQNSIVCY